MKPYQMIFTVLIFITSLIFMVGCMADASSSQIINNVKSAVVSVNDATGWVYEASGIIVTNAHVVEGVQTITVRLNNGTTYVPVSVKTDKVSDLAILKIDAGRLPILQIGDISKAKIGDPVIAFGNVNGKGIVTSSGTINSLGIQGSYYTNIIETNAELNSGSSGGALVNMAGEIIGITFRKSAGPEGWGYAINIQEALPIIQRLSQQD
jgi:serine protease Do